MLAVGLGGVVVYASSNATNCYLMVVYASRNCYLGIVIYKKRKKRVSIQTDLDSNSSSISK